MRRLLMPVAAVLLALGAAFGGSVAPVMVPVAVQPPAERGRVVTVCPPRQAETATATVAATAVEEPVGLAQLSDPTVVDEQPGVAVRRDVADGLLVSAPRSALLGAIAGSKADSGAARGLGLVTCAAPQTEHWFTGVRVSSDEDAKVLLTNLDNTQAVVDLTLFGRDGRVSAPGSRGIVVGARTQRLVSLAALVNTGETITVQATASAGRVAAVIQQSLWKGESPRGADWLAATARPANSLVIPGIPGGAGERELVVFNPGDRTVTVSIEVLGESGRTGIVGQESLVVPPGATRTASVEEGFTKRPGALRLSADQPVTAAVIGSTDPEAKDADFVVLPAVPTMAADTVTPLPVDDKTRVRLLLTNSGPDPATATVAVTDETGAEVAATEVTVPGYATIAYGLPRREIPVVRVRTASAALVGSVLATRGLGSIKGVATAGLPAANMNNLTVQPSQDPRVGG